MQTVVTAYLDESMALLARGSLLVDLYGERRPEFVPETIDWLRSAEQLMKAHHRAQLGSFSALRGRALAAQAGVHEGAPPLRGQGARRRAAGACILLLSQGQEIMRGVHEAMESRRDEAQRLIQQMLQILIQGGSLAGLLAAGATRADQLSQIWNACQGRAEVAAGARQVMGLVSWADALRTIDETLTAWRL